MESRAVAAADERSQSRPLLFISHKHSDSRIADAVRTFVRDRSGGRVEVFQSSSAFAEGPRLGKGLNRELVEALWKASMVVLVYTTADQDWSYCMWECGVATHPQSPDTRIILFQCGGRFPDLFAGEVRVNVRAFADVHRFVNEFLTSPNFFPRYGDPITRFHPNDDSVQEAAQSLYDSLQKVLPPLEEEEAIDQSWPYPFLRLELSSDSVGRIRGEPADRRLPTTIEAVLDSLVIDSDGEARRIFGMARAVPLHTQFRVLVDGWKEKFPDSQPTWLEALSQQIMAAVQGRFPTLRWELMRGMDDYDGTWYAPVVNYVRTIAASQSMQFDVYFDKFELDEDGKSVKVGIPTM